MYNITSKHYHLKSIQTYKPTYKQILTYKLFTNMLQIC